jgi:hypothetical protein
METPGAVDIACGRQRTTMIYEMRTYDIKPGSLPAVEKRFGEAYEARNRPSELCAFWRTEIGPLNQAVYIWRYQDLADRASVRAAAGKSGHWPPGLSEFSAAQRSDILIPAPGSPELKPGKVGPVFEMRICTLAPGELPVAIENWEKALPGRNALRPACAVWYTDVGALDKWIHVWAYESHEQRAAIRQKARESGNWPPTAMARKEGRRACVHVARESKILRPAVFSPVQ